MAPDLPFELTEAALGSVVHEMTDAIMNRELDPSAHVHRHASPDLVAILPFSDWPREITSFKDYLGGFHGHFERHPEYKVKIVNMKFHINNNTGQAECLENLETTGLPPGTVRPSIGTMKFVRNEKGKWEWVHYTVVPGPPIVPGADSWF